MTREYRQIARQALYDALRGPLTSGLVIWTIYALLVLATRAWGGPATLEQPGGAAVFAGPAMLHGGSTTPAPVFAADGFDRASLGSNWTGLARFPGVVSLNGMSANIPAGATIGGAYYNAATLPLPPTIAYACARYAFRAGALASTSAVCFVNASQQAVACCSTDAGKLYLMMDTTGTGYTNFGNTGNTSLYVGVQRTAATTYNCQYSTDGKVWTNFSSQNMSSFLADGVNTGVYFKDNAAPIDCFETGSGNLPTVTPCCNTIPTTTTLILPVAGAADVNCPTTKPTQNATQASSNGYANQGQTCATGANAGGYDVTAISLYVGASTAAKHVQCSVYDGAKNKVATGCDATSIQLISTPNAYITMTPTGACHLAAGTRYWIACNADDTATAFGYNSTACTNCWAWVSQTFGTWPASLGAGGTYNQSPAFYLSVR